GHLVLSTIHTNNAAGTIPRLIDLKINPKIIEAALNIAIAQRLVRRLCLACRQLLPIAPEEKKLLDLVWPGLKKKRPDLVQDGAAVTTLWREKGCLACHGTGWRGRVGLFEAMIMTPAIAALLSENPSEREIKRLMEAQGLLDLREDGWLKILDGITTVAEVGRVVDLYETRL
ncbi:MAG: ATPase, T2SS/T4P/T4SS family, partial [Patescibacteria group bacterium]